MKKVGILTYHSSDNFGSVLQAYATCRMLREEGMDARIVDLRKPEVKKMYSILRLSRNPSVLMATAYNALHFFSLKSRQRRYERFRKERMTLSDRVYHSGRELSEDDPGYDAYIVGSDQIWNMDILDHDRAFFLPFAGNARRIALAASFGPVPKLRILPDMVRDDLRRFDLLTVRESRGADIIETAGLSRPQIVPDPVFSLTKEQWCEVAAPKKRRDRYMLCYFPGVVTAEFDDFTKRVARERGLNRVLLMPHWRNIMRQDCKDYSAGPEEFLGLVRDADMICTNSFHAAAFAVIFEKEFIVGTHSFGADERINTLLQITGLQSNEFHDQGYTYKPTDISGKTESLCSAIEESRRMLLDALK